MRILPNAYKGSWYVDLLFVVLGVGVMVLATFTTVLSQFMYHVCETKKVLMVGAIITIVTALTAYVTHSSIWAIASKMAGLETTFALDCLMTISH